MPRLPAAGRKRTDASRIRAPSPWASQRMNSPGWSSAKRMSQEPRSCPALQRVCPSPVGCDIGEGRHDPPQGFRIAPATVKFVRGNVLDRNRALDLRLVPSSRPSVRSCPGPAPGHGAFGRRSDRWRPRRQRPRGQARRCRGQDDPCEHPVDLAVGPARTARLPLLEHEPDLSPRSRRESLLCCSAMTHLSAVAGLLVASRQMRPDY